LRDKVAELGIPAERIVVQHNGVEGTRFVVRDRDDVRRQLGVPGSLPLVCFVGNLVPEKGPDVLIEAFGGPQTVALRCARLAFIGDGPLKQVLIARAAAMGICDRVSFLGRMPPDDVALWLSAADALCLPSRREGCPNVVLEGLACGRPVVASAVGGVPELLSERNGVMVAPDDSAALAAALSSALQRTWDPQDLRASVPSLTWDDFSRVIYDAVSQSLC
jgi:glycosyltransferase involved in cell wall biosynthesis